MNVTGDEVVTICGIIVPYSWDNDGAVLDISINSFDEEEFVVKKNAKGIELSKYLSHLIEANGIVKLRNDGVKELVIASYQIIQLSDCIDS